MSRATHAGRLLLIRTFIDHGVNPLERATSTTGRRCTSVNKNRKLASCLPGNLLSFETVTSCFVTVHHTRKRQRTMGKGDNSQKNDKKTKKPKQDKKVVKPDAKK